MCEMTKELQDRLWQEASCFVENSSRKHLAHFGVTLEGSDNQYLELSFTCPCCDEDFDDFLTIIDSDFLQTVRFEYQNVRIQEFVCDIPIEVDFDDMTGSIYCNLALEVLKLRFLTNSHIGNVSMTKWLPASENPVRNLI